jgi:adenosine deaminase
MTSYADHPLGRYIELGIPVTINTDNRLMSQVDLSHEYAVVAKAFKFKRESIQGLVTNGVQAAFLPEERKEKLQALVDAFFSQRRL